MSHVLVTGAKGQLGSEIRKLSKFLIQEFIFTDVDELDLTDAAAIKEYLKQNPTDFIVNCAAYTNVDAAEADEARALLLNHGIVENLASAMKDAPGCRLIHLSTDYVIEGDAPVPLKETDSTYPHSVYGQTKLEGEKVLKDNPAAMIIRTSWLYSTFGNNFVKSMLKRLNEGIDLGIVYDQVGSPTYAEDLARAIMQIIQNVDAGEKDFVPGVYHYSNEGVCSWYDFTMEIARLTESNSLIRPIETHEYPLPAKRPAYSVLNKNKIKNQYGVEVPHWRDSLEKCIKTLKRNEQE